MKSFSFVHTADLHLDSPFSGLLQVDSELAKKNQVLLFTCHPETVSAIKEVDNNTPVWYLEGGRCTQDRLSFQ
ncbi:MAG: hypothetical protein JSU72_14325 [Deltaproteobacteria bacterium]|nr:MAG: hypothetical protein JSU72_14325 [Deltaproteobacteria bacterium]